MTNADVFIDKYKQLEEVVRSTYHLRDSDSISFYLSGQVKYQRFRDDIKYCQDVRNLLNHKKKLNNSFAVEPNQQMIDFIDNLIERIKKRAKCNDIQIKICDIFWKSIDGNVKDTMKAMRDNLYTHIPILDNGVVIGVFDENSVFNYLAEEEIVAIDDDLTFEEIKNYISLEGREMEEFLFFKTNSYVEELENEFEKSLKRGKRIGIAFLTQNGKANEKLQGIITPWDIISVPK
ncbi:MAG: CBS domain-containing protein [Ruminococcus sp.]